MPDGTGASCKRPVTGKPLEESHDAVQRISTGNDVERNLTWKRGWPAKRTSRASAKNADQFAQPAAPVDSRPRGVPKAASAIVPASFLRLCEVVALHVDPTRFALLYRLLWRLVHEPGLRHNPLDPDMLHAHQMGQAVRRDMHKMKAFLRFRSVQGDEGGPLQMAWFDPVHHIVEAVAPWFARRSPQA